MRSVSRLVRLLAVALLCLVALPAAAGAFQTSGVGHAASSHSPAAQDTDTPTETATAAATATATATATQTPTVHAMITVTPSTVTAGGMVTIAGSGFGANETITLQLAATSGGGSILFGSTHADANGNFSAANVTIPSSLTAGAYQLLALGLTTLRTAATTLQVTAPTAAITVSPTTFSPNDTITITGTNFQANEQVSLVLATTTGQASIPLGQVQADANGNFTASNLRVPFGVPAGTLQVVATGLTSTRQASATVTVTAATPTVSVTPTAVKPNDTITVTGTHFQPGESVTIDIVTLSNSTQIGTATVGADGTFNLSNATVPANTPEGTASVVATGGTSHLTASTPLTVGALPAGLTLTPSTITAGNTIAVQGTGFIPGETVTIGLTASGLTPLTLGAVVANTSGGFTINSLVIPASIPAGTITVVATGATSGRTASGALTVQAPPPAAPILSIIGVTAVSGVYPAAPGGLLQLTGSNFPAGTNAVVALVCGATTTNLTTIKTSGNGALGPVGVTVPANTPVGACTVQVFVNGKSVATLNLQVAPLAPHLTLSATTVRPNQAIKVSGTGFAPNEQVVLALNGAALTTIPATVLADSHGTFAVIATIPAAVNNGLNTLTATGAISRASVSVSVQGVLPVSSRFYFPHGDTTADHRTVISLLNPGGAAASVTMTFLYAAAPSRTYHQTVPAHSQASVDLALAAGTGREVSTIVESNRQIGAESIIYYGSGDASTALGASAPATTWYLAEGYTGGSFREFLTIMNPNSSFANVDVRFLPFNGHAIREQRFVVRPDSNTRIDAGRYMPNASISAIVTADKGVVVERTMRFGLNERGAHDKIGVTAPSTIWQFAEGESTANRQTFLTILNPSPAAPAAVTATFFDRSGKPVGQKTIVVNPLHRGNIKLNDVVPNAQVATVVTSNTPVVVERPLYEGGPNLSVDPSGSVVFGRNGGGVTWTFPSGNTTGGNRTLFYLFNPGLKAATVGMTVYTSTGATVQQTLTLAPNSVTVLDAANVPGLGAAVFGSVLKSTNGVPFIAEQSQLNPSLRRASSTQGIAE